MGLFDFLRRMVFGSPAQVEQAEAPAWAADDRAAAATPLSGAAHPLADSAMKRSRRSQLRDARRQRQRKLPPPRLVPLKYRPSLVKTAASRELVSEKPYRFGMPAGYGRKFLNLSRDADQRWLDYFGLPLLNTPDDLANWLQIPIGQLAWLCNHQSDNCRPSSVQKSHYHYSFRKKRTSGFRLIEAPKPKLLRLQEMILREILDNVPAHPAAHGFVQGRSILTNARPHVGQRFVLKLDLEQFYPSVHFPRVVAIFRSLGFSREVSLWLARLTTTSIPWNLEPPERLDRSQRWQMMSIYYPRHLPQGAPTSPALANLSAFALDVRLSGLANAFHLKYTRYADDLTFSGESRNVPALRQFIPLTMQVIRAERFRVNLSKRKVIRSNQRQTVTGVVVNEKANVSRSDYDRLKATLTNCVKLGPASQNRNQHEQFAHHLRGRVAHVLQLNRVRGEKLLAIYNKIDWNK